MCKRKMAGAIARMSSLLIFSRPSNTALSGKHQSGQPERGDVVDINAADYFFWGRAVQTMGWWQEVVCPNTSIKEVGGLLTSSSAAVSMDHLSWRHRIWSVDLEALGKGQIPGGVWVVSLERLMACAALKPQAGESAQIGLPSYVIG